MAGRPVMQALHGDDDRGGLAPGPGPAGVVAGNQGGELPDALIDLASFPLIEALAAERGQDQVRGVEVPIAPARARVDGQQAAQVHTCLGCGNTSSDQSSRSMGDSLDARAADRYDHVTCGTYRMNCAYRVDLGYGDRRLPWRRRAHARKEVAYPEANH